MRSIFVFFLFIATISTKAQTGHYVTTYDEYVKFKDTVEKFVQERLFVPSMVGPADSVISSNTLPITLFFIRGLIDGTKDIEMRCLSFVVMFYERLLRDYQQFTQLTLIIEYKNENGVQQQEKIDYYIQSPKHEDEEKRIIVYLKEKQTWSGAKVLKPEYKKF